MSELCTAELFVVSALRLWALHQVADDWQPYWREGFARCGISPAASRGFEVTCRLIAGSVRDLVVHHPMCGRLSDDETRFLDLFGLLQRNRAGTAEAIFADRCPPAVVRLVMDPARVFATALADLQLWLPVQPGQPVLRASLAQPGGNQPRHLH